VDGIKAEVPEIQVATLDTSPIVALVTKKEAGSINCIALADVLHKNYNWTLSKL
jgi:hypothetical protein